MSCSSALAYWRRLTGEYCHVIRFPQRWAVPEFTETGHQLPEYTYRSDYEFRVPGLLETKFLVRGSVTLLDPERYYSKNVYNIDLSSPKTKIVPASEEAWQAATPLRLVGAKLAFDR